MCQSPDFAAIAAQIFDKSGATGRLASSRRDRHDQLLPSSSTSLTKTNERTKLNNVSSPTISVAASKQNMASVAARIAAIEQNDKCTDPPNRQGVQKSNSNWDDLLLDLDVDWRCYQGRETDDQKLHHIQPRNRPPLPIPPSLELLDLDDPLSALPGPPPPLPPKPGNIKPNGKELKAMVMPPQQQQQPLQLLQQQMPPPTPYFLPGPWP